MTGGKYSSMFIMLFTSLILCSVYLLLLALDFDEVNILVGYSSCLEICLCAIILTA